VILAEITTSDRPVGVIDGRMRRTLEKLSRMQGSRYYFVRTEKMEQRALTKVRKASWAITVVRLAI
jgi:hypothetical protein